MLSDQDRLQCFARALGSTDRAVVHSLLPESHDPFASLPAENILQIFDFLHPFYVWSLRAICKRWNALLSSERVVQAQLARLEMHGPADTALQPCLSRRTVQARLRHTQALRLGRPFTYYEIKDDLGSISTLFQRMLYRGMVSKAQ